MEIPASLTAPDPRALPGATVISGLFRVTVLTERILRIEYSDESTFEDRASTSVVNRRFEPVDFLVDDRGSGLTVATSHIRLQIEDTSRPCSGANLHALIGVGSDRAEWRYGEVDAGNLGGTRRTLDGWRGREHQDFLDIDETGMVIFDEWKTQSLDPGLLSRSGWTVVDDSSTPVLAPWPASEGDPGGEVAPTRQQHTGVTRNGWPVARSRDGQTDLYLLANAGDYKALLGDAAGLFGPQPLPPRFAFGYWYSRYYAYTDRELLEIVDEFDQMSIPLDVLVVDMDWHRAGWTGYSWDRRNFPDPDDTLARLHDKDLHVTLNVHPSDGVASHEDSFEQMCSEIGLDPRHVDRIPFDVTDPDYMNAYFKVLHHPEEERGVDFWWMDWQQGERSAIDGLDPLPWLNQLHWQDQLDRQDGSGPDRRPLVFSRWGGLGGGRFPIGFSGDTWSVWESLAYQPEFTSTAANVLFGYWSHDIGGHYGPITTPELYTRWLQFGSYSPVLRTHATKHAEQERRFWEFRDPYRSAMIRAVKHRYEMVPYIYTECRECVSTGVSLVRPMYLEHPRSDAAYNAASQFYFGGSLIVSPVVTPMGDDSMATARTWLPKGKFYDTSRGRLLNIRSSAGEWIEDSYLLDEIPVFAVAGAVVPAQGGATRLNSRSYEALVVTGYPGGEGSYDLYEDDGSTQGYLRGESSTTPIRQRVEADSRSIEVGPTTGGYEGWLSKRSLEVRIVHEIPPAKVTVGRRKVRMATASDGGRGADGGAAGRSSDAAYWYYDAAKATVVVCLFEVDLTKQTTVKIHRDLSRSRGTQRLLDGYPGLARRLDAIAQLAGQASSSSELDPDERLAVDLAQSANRITRDPSTLREELRRVRREVHRLDRIFESWQSAWRTAIRFPFSNQEEAAVATLATARKILATTLNQFDPGATGTGTAGKSKDPA